MTSMTGNKMNIPMGPYRWKHIAVTNPKEQRCIAVATFKIIVCSADANAKCEGKSLSYGYIQSKVWLIENGQCRQTCNPIIMPTRDSFLIRLLKGRLKSISSFLANS